MENVLIAIGIVLLIFAVCREITCWYFKFIAMVDLFTEIRVLQTAPASGLIDPDIQAQVTELDTPSLSLSPR